MARSTGDPPPTRSSSASLSCVMAPSGRRLSRLRSHWPSSSACLEKHDPQGLCRNPLRAEVVQEQLQQRAGRLFVRRNSHRLPRRPGLSLKERPPGPPPHLYLNHLDRIRVADLTPKPPADTTRGSSS